MICVGLISRFGGLCGFNLSWESELGLGIGAEPGRVGCGRRFRTCGGGLEELGPPWKAESAGGAAAVVGRFFARFGSTRPSSGLPDRAEVHRTGETEKWAYSAEGLATRPSTGHQKLAFLEFKFTRPDCVLLGRVEGNRKWEIWKMELLGRVTDYSAGQLC